MLVLAITRNHLRLLNTSPLASKKEIGLCSGANRVWGKLPFFGFFSDDIPDAGDIIYKGDYLNDETVREIRNQTAWLPQDLDLGSDTVQSLVNLPFQFEKNNAKQPARNQIIETFERLGLPASSLEKEFANLSTGQRVGIAICHLLDKPLILLDEPTSALDSASKEKMANLLFSGSKRTIISTSHDPWWIERCDDVVELN